MTFNVYYRVSTDDNTRTRLETVFLSEAQDYARAIYKRENVIANIDEHTKDGSNAR